ncbi:TATA element modulatory factor [Eumeta japonica]|uniref:TATA element modulatory factor n=1 Tax=Eumeta variegata TaxID=151549 RepID=A0A4C1YK18_EUMVA|nr:TATA element modulatory factor [Eumeta japonica]
MSWFDTSGLTSFAKTALKEAQRTIDKALDIQDESSEEQNYASPLQSKTNSPSREIAATDTADFFSSWGLTVSAESGNGTSVVERPVVTESPSKSMSDSLWGSFAGSFFEQSKISHTDSAIIRPPKAKSMNTIADTKYSSQDDLFVKSQLVMSDSTESSDLKKYKLEENVPTTENRRGSSRSNRLSLVSSRNSSDSVEVLGSHSLKTTPDSEAASIHTISQSSGTEQRVNSESVEILPDSLVSPSSIECLGFDSYCSDKNSTPSSNLSPCDSSDKKSITPVRGSTEWPGSADSVSLVADDDDDTMSYNSVSECTAPTVLDTEEKPILSSHIRAAGMRNVMDIQKRIIEKDFIQLDQPAIPQKMQISENSSNDGSWSDKTLNADSDTNAEDSIKTKANSETDQEDMLVDKLSDSSSFYNVNVTTNVPSESLVFVDYKKQESATDSNESSQKDCSIKERNSPISSDSKSDLVKIGSDRTSGHTSGDELETATSSDIEIIPSPNGDNGHGFCRNSPGKYGQFKQSKCDEGGPSNLVDLVLGKSLASKVRGHNRELSEASVQSNTSDESQSSENDRLMRRLFEMAEILEIRENKLLEMSRNNAELSENNTDLKNQVETLLARQEYGDISTITEDYTQRMSALEKKFQQAIREKDHLRKQLDSLKTETASRKSSSEYENMISEKDEMIAQLQEEGEKLAKQQLQHSNIIKKLRVKEKDNEQVIKGLRDKVVELTGELDRLKRSVLAKEELEVSQIETVYRLTNTNKKLETELNENKSLLDDTKQKLDVSRTALDAARRELGELQRGASELRRSQQRQDQLQTTATDALAERDRLRAELEGLRAHHLEEEKRWAARTEALRRELGAARELASSLESRVATGAEGACACGGDAGAGALLAQLAALQRAALERDNAHRTQTRALHAAQAEAEAALVKVRECESAAREEATLERNRAAAADAQLADAHRRIDALSLEVAAAVERVQAAHRHNETKDRELEEVRARCLSAADETERARRRAADLERELTAERAARHLDRRATAPAAQLEQAASSTAAGDISPPHSVASDSLSATLWPQEDSSDSVSLAGAGAGGVGVCGVEELMARLQRRDGEVRSLSTQVARLAEERRALAAQVAQLASRLEDASRVHAQYDELLQMYGEKEEQLAEVRLDLDDVTALYKAQLDELVALKRRAHP